jgi:hypothetical protein
MGAFDTLLMRLSAVAPGSIFNNSCLFIAHIPLIIMRGLSHFSVVLKMRPKIERLQLNQ